MSFNELKAWIEKQTEFLKKDLNIQSVSDVDPRMREQDAYDVDAGVNYKAIEDAVKLGSKVVDEDHRKKDEVAQNVEVRFGGGKKCSSFKSHFIFILILIIPLVFHSLFNFFHSNSI